MRELYDYLPEHCFISHSPRDIKARDLLLRQLPARVRPYSFPRIEAHPNKLASNELIKAILDRDALIYLEGGYSARSFWVAFERDYALRAHKVTARFDPQTEKLRLSDTSPMTLPVFATYAANDKQRVHDMLTFMREERHFQIHDYAAQYAYATAATQVRSTVLEATNTGGYHIVFWTKAASVSKHVDYELPSNNFGRVLFARLDDTPVPDWWYHKLRENPSSVAQPVQLYGDHQRPFIQRMDDLITGVYWLIYRSTHGEFGLE
jgi:hypothetical protein